MVWLALALVVVTMALLLLLVYVVRLGLRIVSMFFAVWFYHAEGTSGPLTVLATIIFNYLVRGKIPRDSR